MSIALHENVRLQVSIILLNILGEAVRQRLRVGSSLELSVLESFIERGSPEYVVMLMPQEVYTAEGKFRVDAVFGGAIAFDYKSREGEFDPAVETAKTKYLPYLSKVKYFVVTNYDSWRIYKVSRGKEVQLTEIYRGGRDGAVGMLKQIITSEVKALKIPPHPASIEALYTLGAEKLIKDLREVFDGVKESSKVKPLFEAYKKVMELLYSEEVSAGEEFYADLFVRHTIMHMMVMASLTATLDLTGDPLDVCSGVLLMADERSLDVALPYLNWWKIVYSEMPKNLQSRVKSVVEDITARAHLVDWGLGGGEDVFRRLYEILVEPETRRRIGEYYTPLWIVDMILREFELRDKLVMDPFCGSGTFLVRAFYKKILEEGEEPEKAYEELVGLDVNPLAVAVARAELVIAYRRTTGKMPSTPPQVYHTDTLAMWFGSRALLMGDPEYLGIIDIITGHIGALSIEKRAALTKMKPQQVLASLSRIEQLLTMGIKLSMSNGRDLESRLRRYLLSKLRDDNVVEGMFKEVIVETTLIPKLAKLIEKYGDSVWAVTIISAVMPSMAKMIKPHIVITNPPWVHVTKYQASYSDKIREVAIKILKENLKIDAKKAASVVTGSDVACMALYKALEIASEGIGFVMYREQSFYSSSSMRSGIILTYIIVRNSCRESCDAKLIDINYDAFEHGLYPALVIVKKNSRVRVHAN